MQNSKTVMFISVVCFNKANTGGGYSVAVSASISDTGSFVHDNIASLQGGGILIQGGEVILEGLTIHNNAAAYGGGVAVGYGQNNFPHLLECMIR